MNLTTKLASALALAGFALLSMPGAAEAANFTGVWAVSGAMGHPLVETVAPVCVFQQSGGTIAGTCKGPAGIGSADGAVSGWKIVWHWRRLATSHMQNTSVVTFRGVWGRNGISGTWVDSAVPGLVGGFTARKR